MMVSKIQLILLIGQLYRNQVDSNEVSKVIAALATSQLILLFLDGLSIESVVYTSVDLLIKIAILFCFAGEAKSPKKQQK